MANAGGWRGLPWRGVGWGAAALILLAPLVAMQFSEEMNWTASDFVFLGVLLGGAGLGLELALRRSGRLADRAAAVVALAAAVLLVWINGAVGVIGGEQEDANLLYGGVLAVALLGAAAARLRPAGMAWAMGAAALAQGLVPAIAALAQGLAPAIAATFGLADPDLVWSPQVLGLTGGFVAMWILSALLFRQAQE